MHAPSEPAPHQETPRVQTLPHSRPTLTHWLATAAALAAVLGGAALLQPSGARASAAEPAARPGPDPDAAAYPVDCGPWEPAVTERAEADFDADGTAETVAAVRCATGTGTPPSGMYVLAHPARGQAPRVVATLVEPADEQTVTDVRVRGGVVTATLLGYSSDAVPRCCPDERRDARWRWQGDAFALGPTALAPAAV
ncbi:hypothetical protein WDH52_14125 [Streptomyces sp. TRM70308]|uniref:hypothetical protein n=1 Tax=Streptomyces sp. TRM70308 TaxID=3131932 RepID=UPI003D06C657